MFVEGALPGERVAAPEIGALGADIFQHVGIPLRAEAEVQEAGTRDLHGVKPAPGKVHIRGEPLCGGAGRHPERFGGSHGVVCRVVAVAGVLRDLHIAVDFGTGGELPLRGGGVIGGVDQGIDLFLCAFDQVHDFISFSFTLMIN